MGRPREFDEIAVLNAAVAEFRQHGYADTSTEQLCDAAGVRRSTLYNTFISKDELFVRALAHFIETTTQTQHHAITEAGPDAPSRLRAWLDVMLREEADAARHGHAAGCMVVGARMTPDLALRDERICQLLDAGLADQLALLDDVILRGQADGTLRADMTPRDGANLLTTLVSGIRVMAQAGSSPDQLRQIARLGLSALLLPGS